jgi:hypothetical protein
MAWRRDEIWFDMELLWFSDRPVARGGLGVSLALEAASFFGAGAALAVDIPNGLTASRLRRAQLQRRRQVRRTRAAALVVAPAAMLTLAAPRLGGGSSTARALHEDPPTLALGPETHAPPVHEAAWPSARAATTRPLEPKPGRATRSRTAQLPEIHWRTATSHGLPYAGSLTAGTQLPVEGPDWVTWNPLEDRVPNRPHRLYGHERTIRTLISVITAYRARNPDAPRVVVGDISIRGGGRMEAHHSHQNGLDVDVYYPRLDGALRAPRTTRQIDVKLAQDLLDRFVAAGAQMIFVGYSTEFRGPKRVVIPYPNHENHMHVRFPPPQG